MSLEVTFNDGEQPKVLTLGLTDGLQLGRQLVNEPRVSQKHAEFERQGDTWYVSDYSTNGTWLNGDKLIKGGPGVALHDGDVRTLPSLPPHNVSLMALLTFVQVLYFVTRKVVVIKVSMPLAVCAPQQMRTPLTSHGNTGDALVPTATSSRQNEFPPTEQGSPVRGQAVSPPRRNANLPAAVCTRRSGCRRRRAFPSACHR